MVTPRDSSLTNVCTNRNFSALTSGDRSSAAGGVKKGLKLRKMKISDSLLREEERGAHTSGKSIGFIKNGVFRWLHTPMDQPTPGM